SGDRVNLKSHLIVFQYEVDDASILGETLRIPDGQNRRPLQALQDRFETLPLRRADKEDQASSHFLRALHLFEREGPSIKCLTREDFLKGASKGILSEDTDCYRTIRTLGTGGRPLDKLCKAVQKCGFNLVLGGPLGERAIAQDVE